MLAPAFRVLGIVFGALVPLSFAATRLPYLKEYTRPSKFEKGWRLLALQRKLNYKHEGFKPVLQFLFNHHIEQEGFFVNRVADDLNTDPSKVIPKTGVPAVEELRLSTRPTDFAEHILLCYDEDTGGPDEEGPKPFNTDEYSDEWRWFGHLTGTQTNALLKVNEETQRWIVYGAIALSLSVICQILALAL
jgi:hypothetical protein